jgi:hypothetical protein
MLYWTYKQFNNKEFIDVACGKPFEDAMSPK